MPYAEVIHVRGETMDGFHNVNKHIGPEAPPGLILAAGGPTEEGIAIFSVWESKADLDRFGAERLGPALAEARAQGSPEFLLRLEVQDIFQSKPAAVSA
jgi:hypothetical protein